MIVSGRSSESRLLAVIMDGAINKNKGSKIIKKELLGVHFTLSFLFYRLKT